MCQFTPHAQKPRHSDTTLVVHPRASRQHRETPAEPVQARAPSLDSAPAQRSPRRASIAQSSSATSQARSLGPLASSPDTGMVGLLSSALVTLMSPTAAAAAVALPPTLPGVFRVASAGTGVTSVNPVTAVVDCRRAVVAAAPEYLPMDACTLLEWLLLAEPIRSGPREAEAAPWPVEGCWRPPVTTLTRPAKRAAASAEGRLAGAAGGGASLCEASRVIVWCRSSWLRMWLILWPSRKVRTVRWSSPAESFW